MKNQILSKASELFISIGFKSVTMDDISKDLGISKKTLYSNFENKTKLIEASLNYVFENINNRISEIKQQEQNPIKELFEIKKYILETLNNNQSSPEYQLQKFFPKIYAQFKSKQLSIVDACIIDNLENGIEKGFYRKDISIHFTSRIYFIGVTGTNDPEIFPLNEYNQKELTDHFLDYHVRSIATEQGLIVLNESLKNQK